PTLMFDPEAIHRAVLNVVTNALDACDGCTRRQVDVATSLSEDGTNALVAVSDSRTGIAPDDIAKIFTVFARHKERHGTGLGLPVSQKIMQEHGGTIRVESQPGSGSKFLLELPVSHPKGDEESPPHEEATGDFDDSDPEVSG